MTYMFRMIWNIKTVVKTIVSKKKPTNKTFQRVLKVSPAVIQKFIKHIIVIEGKSETTAYAYLEDILWFFRYIIYERNIDTKVHELLLNNFSRDKAIKLISSISYIISDDLIKSVTEDDIKNFLFYLQQKNNSASSRNRRLSSLKKFYAYCKDEIHIIDNNPASSITSAKKQKTLPKYLTLNEAVLLLKSIPKNKNYERNRCIVTLFLNCGFRLSELVNINLEDIKDHTIKVFGKGSKERIVYLNESCINAINDYLKARVKLHTIVDKEALFLNSKNGLRLSKRMVEKIVDNALKNAGLSGKGYSTHKLRHTAATLMYQNGVDVLTLKNVLGHENLDTTQIYTHVGDAQLADATNKNPLSKL